MLVLTRNLSQQIVIDDGYEITVAAIDADRAERATLTRLSITQHGVELFPCDVWLARDSQIGLTPELSLTIVEVRYQGEHGHNHAARVRIGVNAPRSVAVHRREVFERIKNETLGGPLGRFTPIKGGEQ